MFNTSLNNGGHGALIDSYHDGHDYYRLYADGFCEQGGRYQSTDTSNIAGFATINLLKPYNNTDYTINLTSAIQNYFPYVNGVGNPVNYNVNKTSFVAGTMYVGGSGYLKSFYWHCTGYITPEETPSATIVYHGWAKVYAGDDVAYIFTKSSEEEVGDAPYTQANGVFVQQPKYPISEITESTLKLTGDSTVYQRRPTKDLTVEE